MFINMTIETEIHTFARLKIQKSSNHFGTLEVSSVEFNLFPESSSVTVYPGPKKEMAEIGGTRYRVAGTVRKT